MFIQKVFELLAGNSISYEEVKSDLSITKNQSLCLCVFPPPQEKSKIFILVPILLLIFYRIIGELLSSLLQCIFPTYASESFFFHGGLGNIINVKCWDFICKPCDNCKIASSAFFILHLSKRRKEKNPPPWQNSTIRITSMNPKPKIKAMSLECHCDHITYDTISTSA